MLFFPEVKSSPVIWVVPLNVGMLIWIVPFQWMSLENLSVQNLFRPCQFIFGMIQNSNFIVRPILTKFQVNFVLQYSLLTSEFSDKGLFTNDVDNILAFFDHLKPCVDIFYGMNIEKKWTFLDKLPTLSCKRSLWTTPNLSLNVLT